MAEDHITTVRSADGTTEHTTVHSAGGSGAGTWIFGLLAVLLLGFAVYYFTGMSESEAAKDNAVTNAANSVGEAAKDVGNAANEAADELKKQ